MNRGVPVLVLAVAVAALLWLLAGNDENPPAGTGTDGTSSGTADPGGAQGPGLNATGTTDPDPPATQPPTSDPTTAVTIRVKGAGGAEVARAVVRVRPDQDGAAAPAKRALGTWILDLPAELAAFSRPVWIEVWNPEGRDGEALPLSPVVRGPFAAGTRRVDIVLPAEQAISGRVLDAGGHATGGVRIVALLDPGPGQRWARQGEAVSTEDGAFRIGGLRVGTHHLETWPIGAHAAAKTFPVEAGADDVIVQLKPGLVATVTIVDADGNPIAGTRVGVGINLAHGMGFATAATAAEGVTDAAGNVRLEALDPAKGYVLGIQTPHARKDVVPHTGWTWKPKSETLRMLRGLQVRGRCQYEDGRPFQGASVTVFPKTVRVFLPSGHSKADGTWVVDRVPAGPVGVQASRGRDDKTWKAEPVAAEAGATDVVLVMKEDPIGTVVVRVEDWPADVPDAHAHLAPEKDGRPTTQGGPGVKVGKDGSARFEGRRLRASYTFYIATPDGARCAYEHGIRPGKQPAMVRLQAAHSIHGRVEMPDGVENLRVYATGAGVFHAARITAHGDFEIPGLPEGTYKIGASAKVGARFLYKTFEASTGGTLHIKLE